METHRKRKLVGIAIAVLAVCAGGAAIAVVTIGSGPVTKVVVSGSAAPLNPGSGGGPGGYPYGGSGSSGGFGRSGGGFRGPGGAGGFGQSLGTAASYLGVTTAALQSDISAGKTLAQVASAQGKSVDGLIAAMVAAQKTQQLDTLVKSGRLTAAQEQQIESSLQQRVTNMVNGTRPSFPGGRGFGGGFGGGGSGSFGGGSSAPPTSSPA